MTMMYTRLLKDMQKQLNKFKYYAPINGFDGEGGVQAKLWEITQTFCNLKTNLPTSKLKTCKIDTQLA